MEPLVTSLLLREGLEVVILVGLRLYLCHSFNNHMSDYVLHAGETMPCEAVQVLFFGSQ